MFDKTISCFTYNNSHFIHYTNGLLSIIKCENNKELKNFSIYNLIKELQLEINQIEIYESTNIFFFLMSDNKKIKIFDAESEKEKFDINLKSEVKCFKVTKNYIVILYKNTIDVHSFEIKTDSNMK